MHSRTGPAGEGRRTICGFNVARECLGGPLLMLVLPPVAYVHLALVLLTPRFAALLADTSLLLLVFTELVLCVALEVLLFLVLVSDPGFVAAPTELSCFCAHCGLEVDDFDHHCGALGACIGRGNMHYFILFLLCAAVLATLAAAEGAVYLTVGMRDYYTAHGRFWTTPSALKDAALTAVGSPRTLTLVALIAAVAQGGAASWFLGGLYTYLVCRGRGSVRRREGRGSASSCRAFLASALDPRFAHASVLVTAGAVANA